MATFIDNFNRSDGSLDGDNGWRTLPRFKIKDNLAVCEPMLGGGGKAFLLRDSPLSGTWFQSSTIPASIAMFPGGVWPKYFLMGCARMDPATGYGIFWEVQWQYTDTLAYSDTYLRVWTINEDGYTEVALSGSGAFPARAAGAPVDAIFVLNNLGEVSLTTGGVTRAGTIDPGPFGSLTGSYAGISTADAYQALPVSHYIFNLGEWRDDWTRSDRDLDGDNGWVQYPRWEVQDSEARLGRGYYPTAASNLIRDTGQKVGHWEWQATITPPPEGYPGTVILGGIARTKNDYLSIAGPVDVASGIWCGVMIYYEDATTPGDAYAFVDIYSSDGDSPIGETISLDAVEGDTITLALEVDDANGIKLFVNDKVLSGVTASNLDLTVPGTWAGILQTSLPIDYYLNRPIERNTRLVIHDSKSTAPHGFLFQATVKGDMDSIALMDPEDSSWQFKITPPGGFKANDIIWFSSDHTIKGVWLQRAPNIFRSLVDSIEPGSVWPIMFPGTNEFIWDSLYMAWDRVWYYPTYWGV